MPLVVISTSLDPNSRSRLLARYARERIALANGAAPSYLDLAEVQPPLPLCDATDAYSHPGLAGLKSRISAASGVLLTIPVYNFAAGATAKNFVELTGDAWEGRVVGIAAAASGPNAFMAPMTIATSLMLDYRCLVLPRFVYATGEAFKGEEITDDKVRARLDQLVDELLRVSAALAQEASGR